MKNQTPDVPISIEAARAFALTGWLSKTLVLCPTYGPVENATAACLEWMRGLGAELIHTSECHDIALHRCLIATLAYRKTSIEMSVEPDRYRYVLWLDGDVSIAQDELVLLFDDFRALGEYATDASISPAVSARYLAKIGNQLEARRLQRTEDGRIPTDFLLGAIARLPPVLSGLGCMLMTVAAFRRHCEMVPAAPADDGGTVYYVCSSGPALRSETEQGPCVWRWSGEHHSFCLAHWRHCGGVYLSRARAVHTRHVLVRPPVDLWLTVEDELLDPPEAEDATEPDVILPAVATRRQQNERGKSM